MLQAKSILSHAQIMLIYANYMENDESVLFCFSHPKKHNHESDNNKK